MARAFMSWLSLFNNRLFGAQGRLATIWFDTIVLHLPREDMIAGVVDRFVVKGEVKATIADELLKCWVPVQSVLPGYAFLSKAWEHDDQKLKGVVLETTREVTKEHHPEVQETDYAFRREVAWAGAGLLEAVSTWCMLNALEACALLPHELETAVVNKVFEPPESSGIEMFSAIASARVPNLKSVPWERILELRLRKVGRGPV
jgi:hypothetical protein